jgi:hypothetical protein
MHENRRPIPYRGTNFVRQPGDACLVHAKRHALMILPAHGTNELWVRRGAYRQVLRRSITRRRNYRTNQIDPCRQAQDQARYIRGGGARTSIVVLDGRTSDPHAPTRYTILCVTNGGVLGPQRPRPNEVTPTAIGRLGRVVMHARMMQTQAVLSSCKSVQVRRILLA